MSDIATIATAALVDVHSEEFRQTATGMARVFEEQTATIVRAYGEMTAASRELVATFTERPYRFHVDIYRDGRRNSDIEYVMDGMNRAAWDCVVNNLNLRSVMSMAKRKEFEEQLEKGKVPPLTAETVMDVIIGMVGMARDFARDAVKEVFDVLRPTRNKNAAKYKTNDAGRVGKKVIMTRAVEPVSGGGFRVGGWNDNRLSAIDGVFHLLDGRTVLRDTPPPLILALKAVVDGVGETEYFKFRVFQNGNMHLTFKRADLLARLNHLGGGGSDEMPSTSPITKPRRKAKGA